MTSIDFRHAPATTVAEALHSGTDIPVAELQAALSNAMERIASLEKDRDDLDQLLQAFNEQMKAAKLHGSGLLRDQ